MSRAFVRESDDEKGPLPERPISPRPNFVTPEGMRQIETRIRELELQRQTARAADDAAGLARIDRDLRYWNQRRATARVVAPWHHPETVLFGVRVMLRYENGSERAYRLVGEDEADPTQGLLSWASPLGQALLGHEAGEGVQFQGGEVTIVRIEC